MLTLTRDSSEDRFLDFYGFCGVLEKQLGAV